MSQQQLIEAMSTIKEQEALAIAQDMVKQGADPFSILDACKQAIRVLIESGRCVYSYLGGSYIQLPPKEGTV